MPTCCRLSTAGFANIRVRAVAIKETGVETPGIACFSLRRIVNRGWRLPIEIEAIGDDAVGDFAIAEEQRLVHAVAIEREIGRLTHPQIVPRRLGIPLVGEIDPVRGLGDDWLQTEPGRTSQLLRKLGADRVSNVDLAALQCR